jgi:hypothetical protein
MFTNSLRVGSNVAIEGKTLIVAWQRLEETLVESNKRYYMRADGGRAAAFRQLGGVNQFIKAIAPDRPLLQIPLLALHMALYYLELGVVEPMLAPNKRGRGRRPVGQVIKIRSAVTMSLLYELGYNRKDAARLVAKGLANLGFKTTPGAVADWRDAFKGRPAADESGGIYRYMLASESKFIGGDHGIKHVRDEKTRNKLHQKEIKTLRQFVLLAHLTSGPDLHKVLLKLQVESARTE